jgi:hypothetical protein
MSGAIAASFVISWPLSSSYTFRKSSWCTTLKFIFHILCPVSSMIVVVDFVSNSLKETSNLNFFIIFSFPLMVALT